jgi:septation ring formation regulator
MTRTDYDEAVKLIDALEQMINHIEIVINELPDIIRISNKVLPDTIKEVEETYNSMTEKGYSLEYLNIEYNINESRKNIDKITQKVKLLNLEDCKFELENMLDFFQSLFIDFEKERLSKKAYLQELNGFKIKLDKVNEQCSSVFNEMDNIKSTYNLSEEDINDINEANKLLVVINDDYKKLTLKDESNATPYSLLFDELEALSNRLNDMDDDFNKTLKSLGNMYDDEERAREQLTEIEDFLQQSRKLIYSYKLPVITEEYFIQLEEANEAIGEVINELEKKPIEIKVLNTRVDTARDLVLKLYNTTRELIKNAKMAEASIVYGNRYRSFYKEIDKGLNTAEKEFYNGNYKLSLDTSTKAIGLVDKEITSKLEELYDK